MSTNPYATPSQTGEDAVDPDDAVPGLLPRVAGSALGVAALFELGTVTSAFLFVYADTWFWVVVCAVLVAGLASLATSPLVFNARDWGTVLGAVVAAGSTLLTLAYLILGRLMGFVPVIGLLTIPVAALAAGLVLASIPGAIRVSRARRALYR